MVDYMKNISLIVFCLLFCTSLVTSVQFTMSCKVCSVSCAYTNCFRVMGDGYDKQVCGTSSCDINMNVSYTITKCTQNVFMTNCPTGLCYYPSSQTGCADQLFDGSSCSTNFSIFAGCTNCQSIINCPYCNSVISSDSSTPLEQCLGTSCGDIGSFNASIFPCTQSGGASCSCCYSFTGSMGNNLAFCTSDNGLTSSAQFNTWGNNKFSKKFEGFFTVMGFVISLTSLLFMV